MDERSGVEKRLIPVNAFIALTSHFDTSWPRTLYDAGYRLEGLEMPAKAADDGKVVIDCVAFAEASNRFLAAESKSGNNIKAQQAQRYAELIPESLVLATRAISGNPDDLSADPLFVCLSGSVERILHGLAGAGCAFPVLAIGDGEVSLCGHPPSDPKLRNALAEPIQVPGPPPFVVQVDEQSKDSEYDRMVATAIVAESSRGVELIGCPDLAARAIVHLTLFGERSRSRLIKRVAEAAERLCGRSDGGWEYRPSTMTRKYPAVKILDSPEHLDTRGRTQSYQGLTARLSGDSDLAAEHGEVDADDVDDERRGEEER